MKTLDEFCGAPPGSFHKTIRQNKILWKLSDLITAAAVRGNTKRKLHFQTRKQKLTDLGWVQVI